MKYEQMAHTEWYRLKENKAIHIYEDEGKWFVKDWNVGFWDIYETDSLEAAKRYVEVYIAS